MARCAAANAAELQPGEGRVGVAARGEHPQRCEGPAIAARAVERERVIAVDEVLDRAQLDRVHAASVRVPRVTG